VRPSWVEVDLAAIRHNVAAIASAVGSSEVCAVVKADGYGHGDVPVAEAALEGGATRVAVALVSEGVGLREAGIEAPILVLSEPLIDDVEDVVRWNLIPAVYRRSFIEALGAAASAGFPVHLKVDTGMHRVGASPEVAEQLTGVQTAYGSDPENISSAGLEASELGGLPCRHGKPSSLAGLAFDPAAPAGGDSAEFLRVIYNTFNQVGWEYEAAQGAYLRSQDKADGSGTLYPTLENLTGEQLAFENVLVLFANHHFVKPTIIEINLMFVEEHRGLLFRDGLVFPVTWSTLRGELRLSDGQGNPLPLKPGQTFLEVVSYQTTWNPDSHIIRYHNP